MSPAPPPLPPGPGRPPAGEPALTCAELARRYGVSRSTVARAIAQGRRAAAAGSERPAPPEPVNPGEPQPRYPAVEMDAWWPSRPGRGRPRKTSPAPKSAPGGEELTR